MKLRQPGFLAENIISHDSEIFDYISELHDYLWKFVKVQIPSASGDLTDYIDIALREAEYKKEVSK